MTLSKDYLAGLIEGEGCFGLYYGVKKDVLSNGETKEYPYYKPMFKIGVRDDDAELINQILETLKIKSKLITTKTDWNTNPILSLQLYGNNVLKLISFLGVNPFVGKKKKEYEIWCEAIRYFYKTVRKDQQNNIKRKEVIMKLKQYHDKLKELKKYKGGNNGRS